MEQCGLISVFGFGSYFRGEAFSDIDLLFVIEGRDDKILSTCEFIERSLECRMGELAELIHPTFVTQGQFSRKPLRDMDQLVHLAGKP